MQLSIVLESLDNVKGQKKKFVELPTIKSVKSIAITYVKRFRKIRKRELL